MWLVGILGLPLKLKMAQKQYSQPASQSASERVVIVSKQNKQIQQQFPTIATATAATVTGMASTRRRASSAAMRRRDHCNVSCGSRCCCWWCFRSVGNKEVVVTATTPTWRSSASFVMAECCWLSAKSVVAIASCYSAKFRERGAF